MEMQSTDAAIKRAKFMFDLNGYFIIRNALSPEEIAEANAAIDAHKFHERVDTRLRNSKDNTPFSGDMKTGRFDMGGMLGWEAPHREMFRKFLCHPNVIPYLHLIIGEGYRLDHSPLIIAQEKGSEGFSLHGGSINPQGQLTPDLLYVQKNNTIYNTLAAASFFLSDQNEGDGGFCVVSGSHKINFAPTDDIMNGQDPEFLRDHIQQPICKAGDVVLFSEATIHGCLPWTADFQRRIALYRFSPNNCAYARGYAEGWPKSYTEGMTPEQEAVMLPPYIQRFDRPYLNSDGTMGGVQSRSETKKQFDEEVFGTKYH